METPPDTSDSASIAVESALYELLTTLQTPVSAPVPVPEATMPTACAICRLSARSVERWLRTFLAEYVNDPAARKVLRRAQGFCPSHTRVLSNSGEALAVAILYADLARLTRERWQQRPPVSSPAAFWHRLRSGSRSAPPGPDAPCPRLRRAAGS